MKFYFVDRTKLFHMFVCDCASDTGKYTLHAPDIRCVLALSVKGKG